jgi:NADH pyrophosphatase NudC (nudix superfamily)
VTAVYQARIISGRPVADGDEISDVAWFTPSQLSGLPLGGFARALLRATGQV